MKIAPPSSPHFEVRRPGECSRAMKPALDRLIADATAAGWNSHDAALAISHLAIEMVIGSRTDDGGAGPDSYGMN